MKKQSLVAIMSIGRQNIYMDFCFEDSIDKSMLLCDFAAPSIFRFSLQWLRMSQPGFWMIVELANKSQCFLVCFGLIVKQLFQICLSLFLNDYFILAHRLRMNLSSSSTLSKLLPGCFSARSILAKNSSFVIKVGSFFSPANLRRYLAARLSRFSSSAIILILRRISAFICIAVIIFYLLGAKLRIKNEINKYIWKN